MVNAMFDAQSVTCLVNLDDCRHTAPYFMTSIGIGARERLAKLRAVKPRPYPRALIRGTVMNGTNAPMTDLMTMTPAMADAE